MRSITRISTLISTLSKGLRSRGFTRLGGLGVVLAIGAAAVATAAIPGPDGAIKGCYATNNGSLLQPHSKGDTRIVDSGEACRSYEKAIAWSQTGPKGDPGAAGPPCLPSNPACVGPRGEPGPQGEAGTVATSQAFFDSNKNSVDIHHTEATIATLRLPPGSYVLEGRVDVFARSPVADNQFVLVACGLGESRANFRAFEQKKLSPGTSGSGQVELTTAVNLDAEASVNLWCADGFGTPEAYAGPATLLATPVGEVNPAPPAG